MQGKSRLDPKHTHTHTHSLLASKQVRLAFNCCWPVRDVIHPSARHTLLRKEIIVPRMVSKKEVPSKTWRNLAAILPRFICRRKTKMPTGTSNKLPLCALCFGGGWGKLQGNWPEMEGPCDSCFDRLPCWNSILWVTRRLPPQTTCS